MPVDIKTLQELKEKSHPGPWFSRDGEIKVDEEKSIILESNIDPETVNYGKRIGRFIGEEGPFTAQFVCLAVNSVYELLEELDAASKIAAESRSAASELADSVEAVVKNLDNFDAADELEEAVKKWEKRIQDTGIKIVTI